MQSCACPSCRSTFRVPADLAGKTVSCPKCRSRLQAKEMSGKTILALAGVSGAAATEEIPQPSRVAKLPGRKTPSGRGFPWLWAGLAGAFLAVVLCGGLGLLGLLLFRTALAPQPTASGKAAQDSPPVATFTAESLHDAHGKNAARFLQDYAGKRITVSGPFREIREYGKGGFSSERAAVLESENSHLWIVCFAANKDDLLSLSQKEKLIVTGAVMDRLNNSVVFLEDCRFKRPGR